MKINIALLDADLTVIGWKADTFWSLDKEKQYAKSHTLDETGRIHDHMINNLQYVLNPKSETICAVTGGLIDSAAYVGWAYEISDMPMNITHQIKNGVVTEI